MRQPTALALVALVSAWIALPAFAAPQFPPPRDAVLEDDPEDPRGVSLILRWRPPAQVPAGWQLVGYRVKMAEQGKEYTVSDLLADPAAMQSKIEGTSPRRLYLAQVEALYVRTGAKFALNPEDPLKIAAGTKVQFSPPASGGPTRPLAKLIDVTKINVLVGSLVYGLIVVLSIATARRRELYVRPIAGLQAVDDAIGRATEMGQPLLYVSGLVGVSSISTIASMLILGHLARRTAAYDTPVLVPCNDALVMAAEREIVREAYLEAGRPDAFRPEDIFFVTESQFGYVAAVDGMILRERPAACFYMGYFFAEALVLAETGNIAGCVQIAGTDADTQLPFFITTCDYTLMGEELYAAGAYLSRHPLLVAQLKGQDIGKTLLAALLVVGVALATLAEFGILPQAFELFMKALATG